VQFAETPVVVVSQTAEVAENHISKSAQYIAADNPDAADRVVDEIQEAVRTPSR